MLKEKLYGETYEIRCTEGCYSIVNNGGTETEPDYCPYCGTALGESMITLLEKE